MTRNDVYRLTGITTLVVLVGNLLVVSMLYGTPSTFFFFLGKLFGDEKFNGTLLVFSLCWYGFIFNWVASVALDRHNLNKTNLRRFSSTMGAYTSNRELRKIQREQDKVTMVYIVGSAIFAFSLNEVLPAPFFFGGFEGFPKALWVFHLIAALVISDVVRSVANKPNDLLFLVSDTRTIETEKKNRAMKEALYEELEDHSDLGF